MLRMTPPLPTHWRRATLKECCIRPDYGFTASASSQPVGPRFLRITDIQNGNVDWERVPFVGTATSSPEESRLQAGDIVIARIGATTGKAFLIKECPEAIFASYLIRVRTKPNTSPEFLSFFFQSSEYWNQIDQRKGGRLKGGVNIPNLESLSLLLPPLPEQQAIAHVLETVQTAKNARQRELVLERERKAALMEHIFTHGIRGEVGRETSIGEVPESWNLVALGAVYETQLGKMLSQKARVGADPKPYLRNANVQWGVVDVSDLYVMDFSEAERDKFSLRRGDLLICEGGEIGRTALWNSELTECYFQKAIHRVRPLSDDVVPEFLRYWMEWAFRIADVYGVTGTQTTIAHLPQEKLEQMKIPNPAKSEQQQIASALSSCDRVIAAVEKEARFLDELFSTLLAELMSGELSVYKLIHGGTAN